MGLISKYPKGADISILNTFYLYPRKKPDGGWDEGSITIVYKDNVDNSKHMECIENPPYTFYKTKDNVLLDCRELYIDENLVEPITVPYRNLVKKIAEVTNNLPFYYENLQNGNPSANRKLHINEQIFFSDMNIEDKYRYEFDQQYTNTPNDHITKAYFDIEVDGIDQKDDFPEPGECPINAISYINPINDTVYVFLLRNSKNPLIQQFEDEVNSGTVEKELKDFIREHVGGWKNEIKYGLKDTQFKFLFYDEEIQLIQDFFIIVNFFKPDFLLAWNMAFDIPYIIARIQQLGFSPEEIMCHPDFPHKVCKYYIDNVDKRTGKFKEFAERGDKCTIASYTVYLDQLIQFASRRKGQSKFQGNKLDYIGMVIANIRKLDYSHITTRIAELPYKNYKVFTFYNIIDTIVQKVVEWYNNDIEYVYNTAMINNTRYDKAHRQVTYLTNRFTKELKKDGYIVGNNPNVFNTKPDEKYDGAHVASPLQLSDYSKFILNGLPINVFDNTVDFDFTAQYPNAADQNNMAPNTQIGMIRIPNQIYANENPFEKENFNRGGKFAEDYMSKNYIEFCHRWLKLADYGTLIKDVIFYCNNVKLSRRNPMRYMRMDGLLDVMRRVPQGQSDNLMTVYRKATDSEPLRVMYRVHPMPAQYLNLTNQIDVDSIMYEEKIRQPQKKKKEEVIVEEEEVCVD